METAAETLLVGGTLAVFYGLILGVPMARARMAGPSAPRHLVNTHLEGLIAGGVLLGLSLAATYSDFAKGVELLAAWLLVAGVAASLAGGTLNWLQGIGDPFAAKSPGFLLQSVSGPAMALGGAILTVGVIAGI
jgi:hypothetical protein